MVNTFNWKFRLKTIVRLDPKNSELKRQRGVENQAGTRGIL
jgi:hypothetical protein